MLTLPEATEGDVVVEEGHEVVLKTPKAPPGSGLKETTPEEESEIQEILDRGSDVDDDEIEEATKRLLACTLLQDEIDDIWDDGAVERVCHDDQHRDVEDPDGQDDTENGNDVGEADGEADCEGAAVEETTEVTAAVGYGSDDAAGAAPRQESNSDDAPPNEMTSLLGNEASGSGTSMASHNDDLLRPSIFTTISDIDVDINTQKRMDFN